MIIILIRISHLWEGVGLFYSAARAVSYYGNPILLNFFKSPKSTIPICYANHESTIPNSHNSPTYNNISHMATTTTTTESRALILLGQGVPPTAVANALGVDISRISQLLADPEFATSVVEKKFESLSKHNERDTAIDSLEDTLVKKLESSMAYMTRPMEILKSFQVINAAKRRGQTAPESLTSKQTIIQLNIPQIILDRFQTNVHNQVIQVGEQSLLTIPSGQMLKQLEASNVPPITISITESETKNDTNTN